MDSRTVHYVLGDDDEAKFEELSSKHPGRVLLCDRRHIQDTQGKQAIRDTNNLHEVRSTATEVPAWPLSDKPRPWPVTISNFPCMLRWPGSGYLRIS